MTLGFRKDLAARFDCDRRFSDSRFETVEACDLRFSQCDCPILETTPLCLMRKG